MDNSNGDIKKSRRMVPLRYVLTPIAIILSAIVLLVIFSLLAPKPAKKPLEIKPPLVEVQDIQRQDIQFAIASQGSVLPRTETVLISQVSGRVTSVNDKFNVGGFFRQGEVILTLDDINYQVALLQAQSRLNAAKARLTEEQARKDQAEQEWKLTGKKLSQAPILALRKPQLQQAQADLKAAQADVKSAQVTLERTKIKAPYDAMIKAKQVDIGQFVTMGTSVATTFAVDYAEVRLPIKQQDIAFLNLPKITENESLASDVVISYTLLGEEKNWSSRLTRYEGEIDSFSRVHYVIAQLDDPYGINQKNSSENPEQELRIGNFVKAKIMGKTIKDIVAIPRHALHDADKLYLVNGDNKLHIQHIDILRSDADFVYTHDQFASDYRVLLTQLQSPVEGMTLRIVGEQDNDDMPAEKTALAINQQDAS